MTNALRLYWRYVGVSTRGQMQYRASFLLMTLATMTRTGMEFFCVWALLARFHRVGAWGLAEVALCYGMASVAFGICDMMSAGFDSFSYLVQNGGFDRLLLRPRTTAGQLYGQELRWRDSGRVAQGLIVLAWAAAALDTHWTPAKIFLLIASILGGACMFSGLFILQATMCFWTVQALEVINCFTYGGVTAANYPLTVYRPWFRYFFTFIVPLACVNYLPLGVIVGRTPAGPPGPAQTAIAWASPLMGAAFLVISLLLWRVGVRHYRSTGS